MRRWVRNGIIIVAVAIVGETLGLLLLPGGSHFANGWFFSAGFTAAVMGSGLLGVAGSSLRAESLHFGVSEFGIHQDAKRARRLSPEFVPWSEMASIRPGSGSNGPFVSIRTSENRVLAFLTTQEGADAAIVGFERWQRGGQAPIERGLGPPEGMLLPMPAATPSAPPTSSPGDSAPANASWQPNSLQRRVMVVGALLTALGAVLVVIFSPGAVSTHGEQLVAFSAIPLMVGIICLATSIGQFPRAVSVSTLGFSVRRRGKVQSIQFRDIVGISSAGLVLECTTGPGRTVGFDSLGAREMRAIQDAYRGFRTGGGSGDATTPSSESVSWIKNPSVAGAAAGFWGPIALLITAVVIVTVLILWKPATYGSLGVVPALAALPSAFCVLTLGTYRRAPSAVGFSEHELRVRYPHHFYPASALVGVRWDDIAALSGRPDRLRTANPDPSMLGSPTTRYLTFRTRAGLTYTLGPVSSEIQHRIIRNVPSTLAIAGSSVPWSA